jgi:hypothetical protein
MSGPIRSRQRERLTIRERNRVRPVIATALAISRSAQGGKNGRNVIVFAELWQKSGCCANRNNSGAAFTNLPHFSFYLQLIGGSCEICTVSVFRQVSTPARANDGEVLQPKIVKSKLDRLEGHFPLF